MRNLCYETNYKPKHTNILMRGYAYCLHRDGSLTAIPMISDDERNVLINTAIMLNEYVEKSDIITGVANRKSKVADDFNRKGSPV